MKQAIKLVALVSLSLSLTAACTDSTADTGGPDDVTGADITGTDESSHELGLSTSALLAFEATEPAAAAEAVAKVTDREGCKRRVRDAERPDVVHVYLDNCTGRLGRHQVSGEVLVTFSKNADGSLHAEHQSVSLTVDGREATRAASADITVTPEGKRVVCRGTKSTTNEKGQTVTREAEHVVTVDRASRCSVLDGTATVHRGDKVIDAVLSGIKVCETDEGHSCPVGVIKATVAGRDKQITKTFDGTQTATVEVSRGGEAATRELLLTCVPVR